MDFLILLATLLVAFIGFLGIAFMWVFATFISLLPYLLIVYVLWLLITHLI